MQRPTNALLWWRAPWALERFLADLIESESRILRPGGPWPSRLDPSCIALAVLGEGGLGFDSLERLALAARWSQALHLHSGGLDDALLTASTLAGWLHAAALALERAAARLTFRSSGSFFMPRSHTHTTEKLAHEAVSWCGQLPGRRRLRTAVASHHIYGMIFTLMVSAELGLPVDDLRGMSPGSVLGTLGAGDLLIGHPVFWDALLCASPSDWPADVVGVTSGAACTEATASGLAAAGLARLLDVYGASETAGIGWRERTSAGWTQYEGAHQLLPAWLRTRDGRLTRQDEAPVDAPDVLHWAPSGAFRIGNRSDGAVMVGGVNVDLERVRRALCAHPDVATAAVRPMHPSEGVRLKAFVVPHAGADLATLLASVSAHLEATLSVAERPRAIRFGGTLPLTPAGKPADWAVHPLEANT
jgi:long-chain acyl-CoA synthetase